MQVRDGLLFLVLAGLAFRCRFSDEPDAWPRRRICFPVIFEGGRVVWFAFRARDVATVGVASSSLEDQKVCIGKIYRFELNISEESKVQRTKGLTFILDRFGHDVGRLNKPSKCEFNTIRRRRRSIRQEILSSQELEKVLFFLNRCYFMDTFVVSERLHFVALVFGHMFSYHPEAGRRERRGECDLDLDIGYCKKCKLLQPEVMVTASGFVTQGP